MLITWYHHFKQPITNTVAAVLKILIQKLCIKRLTVKKTNIKNIDRAEKYIHCIVFNLSK